MSTVNCWYLVLEQTRRESRDHATLSDIYNNNVIVRLAHVGEDVIRLFKKVRISTERTRSRDPLTFFQRARSRRQPRLTTRRPEHAKNMVTYTLMCSLHRAPPSPRELCSCQLKNASGARAINAPQSKQMFRQIGTSKVNAA